MASNYRAGKAKAERGHLSSLRPIRRAVRHHRRSPYLSLVFIFFTLSLPAQGQTLSDFTQAQSTLTQLWTTLQQTQALLATAQAQNAADTQTILNLRNQVAALQAQLAGVPACPPVVICPVCPAPVVCPNPIPPPVITPPPPLPSGSASLAWDAVAGATGYKVYFGTASGAYTQNIPTTLTTMTVGGLSNARWFFVVTAQNATSESGYSNEVFKDIGTAPPPPPATGVIQLTAPLVGSITDSTGAVWSLAPKDPAIEGGLQYLVKRNGANNGTAMSLCYSGGVVYAKNLPTVWVWYSWSDTGWTRVTAPAGCN